MRWEQIQLIPTIQVWVPRLSNPDPVEVIASLAGTPTAAWALTLTDAGTVTEGGVRMQGDTPTANNGDSFVHQSNTESVSFQSDTPAAANGATFTFQSNDESLSFQSDTPTPANAQTWVFQSPGNEEIGLQADTPTPANGQV